jgi:hypothetical protein
VHLSKETFRHWKRVLPAMKNRRGRATAFSTGDVVALRILRALTDDWGIQISHLAGLSTEIFRLCNATAWVALEGSTLQINVPEGSCKLLKKIPGSDETVLIYPLGPALRALRDDFLRTEPRHSQGELRLPPTPLRQRAGGT